MPSPRKGALLFFTSMTKAKQRVIVYVDGYNFYFGLRENNWKKFYWLDIVSFIEKFMGENQELIAVKYFSAPTNNYSKERQDRFFSANRKDKKFNLISGSFLPKQIDCIHCSKDFTIEEEKKTDVNIATNLIADCIYNNCDVSILVSGDSDLTPPLEFIKKHNKNHIITIFFPPKRQGLHLKQLAHNTLFLINYKNRFENSLLPDKVELHSGYIIHRPTSWK